MSNFLKGVLRDRSEDRGALGCGNAEFSRDQAGLKVFEVTRPRQIGIATRPPLPPFWTYHANWISKSAVKNEARWIARLIALVSAQGPACRWLSFPRRSTAKMARQSL